MGVGFYDCQCAPFRRSVAPGSYPLALVAALLGTDERIAFGVVRFSNRPAVKWEMAVTGDQDITKLKGDEVFGYGVDSGTGGFCDASAMQLIQEANENDIPFFEQDR